MASAGSRQAASSKNDDSVKHGLDDGGDSDDGISSVDSDGNKWIPLWRTIRKRKLNQGVCEDSRGCGTPPPAPAHQRCSILPKCPNGNGTATEWVQRVMSHAKQRLGNGKN